MDTQTFSTWNNKLSVDGYTNFLEMDTQTFWTWTNKFSLPGQTNFLDLN